MSLPDYVVWFRGKPACPCQAKWVPAFEAELNRRGILDGQVYVYQLIGGADASAGTHTLGGAIDDNQTSDAANWVARQMGADASWTRLPPAFTVHAHRVLRGCPHNGPAAYQITAVDAGYNGLGSGGMGGPDDGPQPLSGRTWREGIEWARKQGEFTMDDAAKTRFDRIDAQQAKILDRLAKTAAIRTALAGLRKQSRVDARDLDRIIEKLDELAQSDDA